MLNGVPKAPAIEVYQNICYGPVSLDLIDIHGNPAWLTSSLVSVLSATNNGAFYNADCKIPVGQTAVPAGATSVGGLFFKGSSLGDMTLSAAGNSTVGGESAMVKVVAPPPLSLELTAPQAATVGTCVEVKVTAVDSSTRQPAVIDPIVFVLGTAGTAQTNLLYSASDCGTLLNPAALRIESGSNPVSFHVNNTVSEPVTFSATALAQTAAQGSTTVTFQPDVPNKLAFDGAGAFTLVQGVCTGPYILRAEDQFGNLSLVTTATPISFQKSGSIIDAFSDCQQNPVSVAAQQSATQVFLIGQAAGSGGLIASATELSPSSERTWSIVNPPAEITGITPRSGPTTGGTRITLTGNSFMNGAEIKVGTNPCGSVTYNSTTRMTCLTPSGTAGFARVVVTNPSSLPSEVTNGFEYFDTPPPPGITVTGITPNRGPSSGGTAVTIGGSGFTSGALVNLGSSACNTVVVVSSSSITCVTAQLANAQTVDVVVRNSNGDEAAFSGGFTYFNPSAPVISSVTPNTGIETGGTLIILTGTQFESGATISLGGADCTGPVASQTLATCTTALHAPGPVDVVVTNPGGLSGTFAQGFEYLGRPKITSILPDKGPITGDTQIGITAAHCA
jgi:hypothetical protein